MAGLTWFITGVSSGLGRALSDHLIDQGDFVIGTVRQSSLKDELNQAWGSKGRAVVLDVCDHEAIPIVINQVIHEFERIDCLVNNAGYGLIGAVEETSLTEARAQMETNFFGALHVTQAFLPLMRQQRAGHIFQISSIAGLVSAPGLGLYNASKFALEGLSEALAHELTPFGIKLTLIEPGPFRTEWSGQSMRRSQHQSAAYEGNPAHRFIENLKAHHNQQSGDPAKAAKVFYALSRHQNPPLRLLLGSEALQRAHAKLDAQQKEMKTWADESLSTDYESK